MEACVERCNASWINDSRTAVIKKVLTWAFPLFLVFFAELNQMHSVGKLFAFILESPGIFLFDLIFTMLVYGLLLISMRYAGAAMVVMGLVYYIISWIEYFKFTISGSHFVIADFVMTSSAFDVVQFVDLKITFTLIFNFLMLAVYCTMAFVLRIRVHETLKRSLLGGGICAGVLLLFFFVHPVHDTVFAVAGIDGQETNNAFEVNDKFKRNNLIAFWVQSIVQAQTKQVVEPPDYSVQTMAALLDESEDTLVASGQRPNIVVVMSESYGDFRKFGNIEVPDEPYQNFDRIAREGVTGKAVMPTFGGYTAKSEFELLFGLPVRAINTPDIPHRLLDPAQDHETFARYYDALGYETVYLHPFDRYFYNRFEIYATYGFDQMLFDEELDVQNNRFRKYADDALVFRTIQEKMYESDQPVFAFATTIQNHTPYYDDPETDNEFTYYLENIRHSDEAYGAFIDSLRECKEPVIVLFVGDHYPFFSTKDNIYDKIGINGDNCDVIYEQQYLIWSNRPLDATIVDEHPMVSAYYLPHLLVEMAGLPKSDFIETVLERIDEVPIYSPSHHGSVQTDEVLDQLTYDRTLGRNYTATLP